MSASDSCAEKDRKWGPTPEVSKRMDDAALLVEGGQSMAKASQLLKLPKNTIGRYAYEYRTIWKEKRKHARKLLRLLKYKTPEGHRKQARIRHRIQEGTIRIAAGRSQGGASRDMGLAETTLGNLLRDYPGVAKTAKQSAKRTVQMIDETRAKSLEPPPEIAQVIRKGLAFVGAGMLRSEASRKCGNYPSFLTNYEHLYPGFFAEVCEELRIQNPVRQRSKNGKPSPAAMARIREIAQCRAVGMSRKMAEKELGLSDGRVQYYETKYPAESRKEREAVNGLSGEVGQKVDSETREQMERAARLVATGRSMLEASQKLTRPDNYVDSCAKRYPGFWQFLIIAARKPSYGVRKRMERAALVVASGMPMAEASRREDLPNDYISLYAKRHPELWAFLLDSARRDTLRIPKDRIQRARLVYESDGKPVLRKKKRGRPTKKGAVILQGYGKTVFVLGKEKPPLTKAEYNVVKTLLDAGPGGLTKKLLKEKSGHGGARNILTRLAKRDSDWAKVISLAGTTGGGYRINTET